MLDTVLGFHANILRSSFDADALCGRFRTFFFVGVGVLADEGRMLFCKEIKDTTSIKIYELK